MSTYSLRHLTDDAITRELDAATAVDRRSTAALLARIAEYDRRRLFVDVGFSSMFRYCVGKLRMSGDAAYKRIQAGRAALEHPEVFEAIAEGLLSLTAVVLVAPHLTDDNAADLLTAARHRTTKQLRGLLAERFGLATHPMGALRVVAPADTVAGPVSFSPPTEVELVLKPVAPPHPNGAEPVELVSKPVESLPIQGPGQVEAPATPALGGAGTAPPPRRARLVPVAPGQYELVAILGQEANDQLVASVDLLGHAVPSGDLAEVIERAIALQFAHLRRRRCGAADQPRDGSQHRSTNPRHVPRAVVRAVWERDGDQCAFVGTGGHRCESRDRLELDHIVPVARGGKSTLENLRLLCHVHNQHVAEQVFGAATVQGRREAAQRRRAEERLRRQADRERTDARKREIARQSEELGEAFRSLGYRGDELRRALACCATRPQAPPEERLRYALGCMAPNARRELPAESPAG